MDVGRWKRGDGFSWLGSFSGGIWDEAGEFSEELGVGGIGGDVGGFVGVGLVIVALAVEVGRGRQTGQVEEDEGHGLADFARRRAAAARRAVIARIGLLPNWRSQAASALRRLRRMASTVLRRAASASRRRNAPTNAA